jgi:hypothetical protein
MQRLVEAFNIGPYLEWVRHQPKEAGVTGSEEAYGLGSIETIILDTLNGVKGDTGDTDQPSFQYHRGATLLIVIGNVDSVEIARKIVNALPGMGGPGDDSRARFGSAADRAARESSDDAFRARYGLARRAAPTAQSEPIEPESGSKK